MVKAKKVKKQEKHTYRDMVIKAVAKLERNKKVTTFAAICQYILKRFRLEKRHTFLIKQTINYLVMRQVLSQKKDQYKVQKLQFSADVAPRSKKAKAKRQQMDLRRSNRYKGSLRSKSLNDEKRWK